MYKGGSSGYVRKPLYPGPPKNGASAIGTKYSRQKDIRGGRNPANKAKVSNGDSYSNYRPFDPEENKNDEVEFVPYKRIQISDCTNRDLETMRRRIEVLEEENRKKDLLISTLKADKTQLRAQMNVLRGKLKRKDSEAQRELGHQAHINKGPSNIAHANPAWSSSAKKMSGKLLKLEYNLI